jgi:hypothetical protein
MPGIGNVPTAVAPTPVPTVNAPFANYGEILSGKSYSFKDYLTNAAVQPISFPGPATNPQGIYNVTATLLSTKPIASISGTAQIAERWRLDSTGAVKDIYGGTIATAENIAVIETLVTPVVTHAICANSLSTTGTYKTIDSYDSSTDPMEMMSGPTSIGSFSGSTGSFAGLGNGCTCNISQVNLSTASEAASGGAGGAICGDATSGCSNQNLCPTLPPVPATCTNSVDGWTPIHGMTNGPFTATPTPGTGSCPVVASYNRGDFTGGMNVQVDAPAGACGDVSFWFGNLTGPIIFDNITNRTGAGSCAGSMNIYVNQYLGGGIQVRGSYNSPVKLYLADSPAQAPNTDMDGVNTSPLAPDVNTYPGNLVILLSNPATTLFIKGNETFSAVIYGPTANVDFQDNGGKGFKGSIFANNFSRKGIVHFDRSLTNAYGQAANFVVQTEVKRVY